MEKDKLAYLRGIFMSISSLVDFTVDVEKGREPVILQLADPQIIDSRQLRFPERLGDVQIDIWDTHRDYERCYKYLEEIIRETNPDFIFIVGDLIYGEFDDKGTALLKFIEFMESFKIPWAPVFGNHDGETRKGIDWVCEQLHNAEYCLFKQRELIGNSNYTVGITQDGKLLRVFYLMDTNDYGTSPRITLDNGHSTTKMGLQPDQIEWYRNSIKEIKTVYPDVKFSFAFHAAIYAFCDAFKKYGVGFENEEAVNIDALSNKDESDFGYIGLNNKLRWYWDRDYVVWDDIKAFGVDSVFVGHVHEYSSSIVYEGVRLQYGQKSSEYCDCNWIQNDKLVHKGILFDSPSVVGGNVMPLDENGNFVNPHIYYCKTAGGQFDFSKLK